MGCRKFQAWLPLMADCLLSEKKQAQLEKHLAKCPECQKEVSIYKTIVERCCQLPDAEIPNDFYDRLSHKLRLECTQQDSQYKPWIWRMPLMVGSLSAAALLAILITLPPKDTKTPNTFVSFFPTKSQALKLAPLLNPSPAKLNQTNITARRHTTSKPSELLLAKEFKQSENKTQPLEEDATVLNITSQVIPTPGAGNVTSVSEVSIQRSLLRTTSFSSRAQSIPVYSVPHTQTIVQSDPELATKVMVTDRLHSDIPLRPKPDCMIVRNPIQLQQAMEKAKQTTPLFTDLDWKKQMLAAIFLDPTYCPGHQLQLDAIEQMPDKITVRYKIQRPTSLIPNDAPPPSLFLVLPYSDLPVEFSEQ
jgi:hypothetical protein